MHTQVALCLEFNVVKSFKIFESNKDEWPIVALVRDDKVVS